MVSTNFVQYLDNMIVLLSTGLLIRVHNFMIFLTKKSVELIFQSVLG